VVLAARSGSDDYHYRGGKVSNIAGRIKRPSGPVRAGRAERVEWADFAGQRGEYGAIGAFGFDLSIVPNRRDTEMFHGVPCAPAGGCLRLPRIRVVQPTSPARPDGAAGNQVRATSPTDASARDLHARHPTIRPPRRQPHEATRAADRQAHRCFARTGGRRATRANDDARGGRSGAGLGGGDRLAGRPRRGGSPYEGLCWRYGLRIGCDGDRQRPGAVARHDAFVAGARSSSGVVRSDGGSRLRFPGGRFLDRARDSRSAGSSAAGTAR
jgi:hypothetical protein